MEPLTELAESPAQAPQPRSLLHLEIDARDPYQAAQLVEAWPGDVIARLLEGLM